MSALDIALLEPETVRALSEMKRKFEPEKPERGF